MHSRYNRFSAFCTFSPLLIISIYGDAMEEHYYIGALKHTDYNEAAVHVLSYAGRERQDKETPTLSVDNSPAPVVSLRLLT